MKSDLSISNAAYIYRSSFLGVAAFGMLISLFGSLGLFWGMVIIDIISIFELVAVKKMRFLFVNEKKYRIYFLLVIFIGNILGGIYYDNNENRFIGVIIALILISLVTIYFDKYFQSLLKKQILSDE